MKKFIIKFINWCVRVLEAIRIRLSVPDKNSPDYIANQRAKKWFADDGDNTLRLNYELDEQSIVFDIGGYKGEFASLMISKYDCTVFIFEPVQEFYDIIVNKFLKNNNVKPYRFGLADVTSSQKISMTDNSSSVFINDANAVTIDLKSASEFIKENNIVSVDLVKINIEGSEYGLLESLIENNLITRFKNIQVQFHDFIVPNARQRMEKIQQALSKTHEITYQYDFIWENWKLKN